VGRLPERQSSIGDDMSYQIDTKNSVSVNFEEDGGITLIISLKREKYNELVTEHREMLLELMAVMSSSVGQAEGSPS
jgi:hypothetical protein